MRRLPILFITIAVICLLSTCKKEYSYEGGPAIANDSATYTPEGFPNACLNTTITGNYITGVKLTSSNYLTLMVNVTKTGHYQITIPALNGISFSAIGKFTNTGVQAVVLHATGTPQLPGVFEIPVSAGIGTCRFSITVNSPPIQTQALNSWEFKQNNKTYSGYFDGALSTIVNGSIILTLVGLTPTKDTAISIWIDIPGAVIKTGNYSSKNNTTFVFFDNLGNNIFFSDKNHLNVELIVVIASYDATTQIITGTFSGTAMNRLNESVPITDGKFRAKLNQ